MALKVSRVDVWAATIKDKAGGLAEKLAPLAQSGANVEFVIARRAPDKPGNGVVFLTPLRGAAQLRAAKKAGFSKSKGLHSLRIEGTNKSGVGAMITEALGAAGVNLRGLSAAAVSKRFVAHLALDTAADAAKAMRILKKM